MYKIHTKLTVAWQSPLLSGLILLTAAISPAALAHCPPLANVSSLHTQARQAFTETYGRSYWLQAGRLGTLAAELQALQFDGLNPADYHLDSIKQSAKYLATWGIILDCDAQIASHAYLLALADLRFGRARTLGVDPVWYAARLRPQAEPAELLKLAAVGETGIADAFAQARPELMHYRKLRLAYQKALHTLPATWPYMPAGPTLSQGDRDARVAILKLRLASEGYYSGTGPEDLSDPGFNEQLTVALKHFQRRHGLQIDGRAGPATLHELNVTPAERLAQIRSNLERLRWLPADTHQHLLLVNIAAATIAYYTNGERVWSGRAQVGQPERATPQLKSIITHVTVNPSWTVPTSIFIKDQLPHILKNPAYLQQHNIRVFDRQGQEQNTADVDWSQPWRVSLKQDPGPGNALGKVVLRFANPFAVYLHDTPSASLFNTPSRFYSSGCVRVEDALTLTRILLETNAPRRQQIFEQALASGESLNVHLARGVPLVMSYWTADADSDGTVYYHPDTYQDDKRVLGLLSHFAP
ncbi:L,D-transpeptidase family protein [Marinobacter sp. X15-166B]|uniref:L,D-transpeptidase family protein n=1 Tax=Marinobacter sp. X15-166B TaxID=1897620 RepID=UPI00085C7A8A|nr:L,D-transpeptidase family protein [Marinobacter sp. X15-166B]OEY65325.1 hypothetical protein BG841_01840 [Marinobacter sp. X15-166B]